MYETYEGNRYKEFIKKDPSGMRFLLKAYKTEEEDDDRDPPLFHFCLCPGYDHAEHHINGAEAAKSWTPFTDLTSLDFTQHSITDRLATRGLFA